MTAAGELDGRRSIDELLRFYSQMGIPHFQRGLVWDTGAVSLLLESIYHGTPCGSIILWAPPDAALQGIPLGESSARFLIVDGQQRIRSLHSVFANGSADGPASENDVEEGPYDSEDSERDDGIWCLNLGRLPEFAASFEGGRRYQLFRRVRDPRGPIQAGRPRVDREALLPLKWFTDSDGVHQFVDLPENQAIAKAAKAVLANETVSQQLRQMRSRRAFDVSTLDSGHSHQDVVATFNRINSSGKRVEAEEKAFANLVASCDHAEDAIRAFFEQTWEKTKRKWVHGTIEALTHDDLLQRQKESRFGFKLFMRVFVMALVYHSNRSLGSASLSFDSADQETLFKVRDHLRPILDATVDLLVAVKTILREKLCCDDFRMLPETASLWPVFQLLIRFPQLVTERDVVAAVALRLMVTNVGKNVGNRELLALCASINKAQNAAEALAVFEGDGLGSGDVAKAISSGLSEAQSLTNRYVLVFYWLLRSREAADFSYDLNLPAHAAELRKLYSTDSEPLLSESIEPEKQHIVPYKRLKRLFNLSGARPGRHPIHNIGNVTYISAGENSFTTGVGENPLKLDGEPRSNLQAHMLGDTELTAFEALCPASGQAGVQGKKAESEYAGFCGTRREKIAEELIRWEMTLRDQSVGRGAATASLLPAPRRIAPGPVDRMLALDYAQAISQSLMRLFQRGMKPVSNKDVDLAMAYSPKGVGKGQAVRVSLFAGGKRIGLKLSDPRIASEFIARFGIHTRVRKGVPGCDIPTHNQADAGRAAEILDWISKKLWPDGEGPVTV